MHEKALASAADEVVLDLEDAVAASAKPQARETVAHSLSLTDRRRRTVAVRINASGSPECAADLQMLATLPADQELSVVVPKVESGEQLMDLASRIPERLGLQALIETAVGVEAIAEIAGATPRLRTLILGYADLATSLGRRGAEADPDQWDYYREALLSAARAAGLQAIDGPFFRLGERLMLARAARSVRMLGFDGKWAIHPDQVGVLNDEFSATETELEWASAVSDSLDAAMSRGDAAVRVDGAMVDEAMRAHATRLTRLPRRQLSRQPDRDGPPFYEDLSVGDRFIAPGVTITDGMAALHQAIAGDRLRLALDRPLCSAVTGRSTQLVHPMLVCDIGIGQSTFPSGRVLGNLFYRGLVARPVHVGETLRTVTIVAGKRRASSQKTPRGMVLLHVVATNSEGRVVLDYHRCPLLPARALDSAETGDDIQELAAAVGEPSVTESVPQDWRLEPLRTEPLGPLFKDLRVGRCWRLQAGETVSSAPELARLTLNLAMTHTDASAGAYSERLVYGGHVVGVAAAHLTRALPDLATVLAWRSCDHLGPTFEGDLLHSEITLEALHPLPDGGLVEARITMSALGSRDSDPRPVLDWRLTALMP